VAVYISPTEERSIKAMIRALRKHGFVCNCQELADLSVITRPQVYAAMGKMRKLIRDNDWRYLYLIHYGTNGPNETVPRFFLTSKFETKDEHDYRELADLSGSITVVKKCIAFQEHELKCVERDLDTMPTTNPIWSQKDSEIRLIQSTINMLYIRLNDLNGRFGVVISKPPPPPPPPAPIPRARFFT
jgi:hypothetical protein